MPENHQIAIVLFSIAILFTMIGMLQIITTKEERKQMGVRLPGEDE